MKKETVVWQLIALVLGVSLIVSVKTYFNDKNEIEADTNRANCLINVYKNEVLVGIQDLMIICDRIELPKK